MFDRIKDSIEKFSSRSVADEEAVEQLVKDVQRDLIQADVDVELVSELSDDVREEALSEEAPSGLSRKEHVLEILYNRLEELLGDEAEIRQGEHDVLLCGLYGAGKTTTAGKLADYYRKRGFKVGLVAADTDRPAAFEQLQQVADDVDAEFYGEKGADEPAKVVENADSELDVDIKIIVMPADIGQSAREQAEKFDDAVGITGVIVTKMDSSAKGGGALVACEHSGVNVKFVGTGEKMGDLEKYEPVDFVSEMMGQPDLESLLEKVEELDTDPEQLLEGEFTMEDFRDQMESVTGSGMMDELMQQLPFSKDKLPDDISQMTDQKIGKYSVIIDSMTDEEKKDPS
ncbi:MAG: signal recognition particle receptor subunit alpha, partial [Candidatus Nanohaloarchaea archaeon]